MKKYLIALDMDGTLLNNNNQISNLTKNYLIKLASQGHKIIISSGRPIRGIISYYKELKLNTPIICYNGAYIYPGKENIEEYCFSFSYKLIKQIINDITYEYIDNIILETNDDIYLLHEDKTLEPYFSTQGMNVHIGLIENNLFQDTMTMLIKVKDPKYNPIIEQAINKYDNIKLRFWSGEWLKISEIYHINTNKGKALEKIAEYYNINKEHIIAFGDADNDIELLKYAGISVAMKNGEEKIKEIAKLISLEDNNNDGIKLTLEKII